MRVMRRQPRRLPLDNVSVGTYVFRRLRHTDGLLVPEAPIAFRRGLPSGRSETQCSGIRVEVRIHPDLRIIVVRPPVFAVALTGRYSFGAVVWDQLPSPDFPATSLAMLTADVHDALRLFRLREIHPRAWTQCPEALAHL